MNILIFDTETTSLDKPFCYNIGYVVATTTGETLVQRDYVVEQAWHNLPLFSSAYYAEKRPLYVARMRARQTVMDKFGYICQQIARDIKTFGIEHAYAYNSGFDERVFEFNCDWYKCINPFETITVHDIRGYVHNFIVNDNFKKWCDENNAYTDTGNYSTTAETIYRYLSGDTTFEEEHTALSDSVIEYEILGACINNGANIKTDYQVFRSIENTRERTLTITTRENETFSFQFSKMRMNKAKTEIKLK